MRIPLVTPNRVWSPSYSLRISPDILLFCLSFFQTHFGGVGVSSVKPPRAERLLIVPPFARAPGCEGSLWLWHSVTDTGTSTWKDSMFKAAGADGGEYAASRKLPFYVLPSRPRSLPPSPHSLHFLSLSLPLLFSLICLPYRASRESVLSSRSVPDSAKRKADWGKSVQVGALRSALLNLPGSLGFVADGHAPLWLPVQYEVVGTRSWSLKIWRWRSSLSLWLVEGKIHEGNKLRVK